MTKEAKISSEAQIKGFLQDKDNKKYHYNDYEELEYKIPSGSLNLDLALGGGLPAGVHRFTGVKEKPLAPLLLRVTFRSISKRTVRLFTLKARGA